MVAVKRNSKPVSTTTNKALYIDTKEMPQNCRRLSVMPKTQERAVKTNPYQPGAKSCNLCLAEKLAILQSNPATSLNKRSEHNSKMPPQKQVQIEKFYCVGLPIECDA